MVEDLELDLRAMKRAASAGHSTATDLADWLVLKLGLPFREAHKITGKIVALAESKGVDLKKLPLSELKSVEKGITEEVYSALDVAGSVKSRTSYGGTAPSSVKREARRWIKRLEKDGQTR
jgi:argininosuccinate lyase